MKKTQKTRIALAQINPTVGALEANRDKIKDYIGKAKKNMADMVVFPELAICGYPPEDLLLKPHFIRDNVRMLNSLKRCTRGITAVIGFADIDGRRKVYNAAAVLRNGKLKGVYRKNELPNYGVFDERRYFTPGNKSGVFRMGEVVFGVNICEDIWTDKGPYREQAKAGAKLFLNISASPYHAGKGEERRRLLSRRAREVRSFVCYTNLVGGQDELIFDGRSLVLGPAGRTIASGREFEEDLIFADLDIPVPSGRSRKKDQGRPPIPASRHKKLNRVEEIYSALVLGTRDYVKKNGFRKVVLGLSGGMDSALTAVIAYDALGKENVIGLSMPSQYSSRGTVSDAKKIADNLGIKMIQIPIKRIFGAYMKILKKKFAGKRPDVTEENLQARIRGNLLMAFSNKYGWLVLATGNKSETAVGYCTLYGDMVGGFAVIKDVPKTLVYELAGFVNERSKRGLIPQSVFTRPPSAELKRGQKDTDLLPPYDFLDPVLKAYIEEDKGFYKIREKGVKPGLLKKLINMVDRNEYKRRQGPSGIKITPKAFGKDRRLPVTNRYRESGR